MYRGRNFDFNFNRMFTSKIFTEFYEKWFEVVLCVMDYTLKVEFYVDTERK